MLPLLAYYLSKSSKKADLLLLYPVRVAFIAYRSSGMALDKQRTTYIDSWSFHRIYVLFCIDKIFLLSSTFFKQTIYWMCCYYHY